MLELDEFARLPRYVCSGHGRKAQLPGPSDVSLEHKSKAFGKLPPGGQGVGVLPEDELKIGLCK